LNSHSVARTGF